MEEKSRPNILILRPDLYTGYLLMVAVVITAIEVAIVAWAPRAGQIVLAMGWIALLVLSFDRLWDVKIAYQLTSRMEIYRVFVAFVVVAVLSWVGYISFRSAPEAMLLPLLVAARFLVFQNMIAAVNSAVIAALAIYILDEIRELTDAR
jgi:hypothetical protein